MNDNTVFAQQYAKKMQIIEENILNLLDEEEPQAKSYNTIKELIKNIQAEYKQHDSCEVLYLLISIIGNHHRTPKFFDKIIIIGFYRKTLLMIEKLREDKINIKHNTRITEIIFYRRASDA